MHGPASLSDLLGGARLALEIPSFLRHRVEPSQGQTIVERRRRARPGDFLALVRRSVYAYRESPYRELLRRAGCEYGDLERLVTQSGLEEALHVLFRQGVYLTVDEMKGRCPVVRGADRIEIDPMRLRNPATVSHGVARTSGSRGPSTLVPIDLAFIGEVAVNKRLTLDASGAGPWRLAYWDVPGATVFALLAYAKGGVPPARWFSPVNPAEPGLHPRYRWSARVLRWASWRSGAPLPAPETVPVDAPLPIARWMAEVLRDGATPLLVTYSSLGVRLCRAALEAGLDLRGAKLRLYGEPTTEARLAVIGQSGAEARALYATVEAWRIGDACLAPAAPDDVHFFDDLHALIQPGPDAARPGLPARALLLTSLRPTAPVVLLNASVGDQAEVGQRACGCALERVGWTTHLHAIRSYEKLTAGGMTFLDGDVVRLLDEVLPTRFGGTATDYQLVEDESPDGEPRIRLLVHPAVGALDTAAVARAFLEEIGPGFGAERVMARIWQDADLVRIERRPPLTTSSGKILHLHTERKR